MTDLSKGKGVLSKSKKLSGLVKIIDNIQDLSKKASGYVHKASSATMDVEGLVPKPIAKAEPETADAVSEVKNEQIVEIEVEEVGVTELAHEDSSVDEDVDRIIAKLQTADFPHLLE